MYTRNEIPVKERLLEGALLCLQERGYAETTARDVAAVAGANLRSIGYHFGSTKQLLLAAISLNFRRWLEPLIAAAGDAERSPAERFRLGMERFVESLAVNGPMLRAWLEAIALAGHEAELGAGLAGNQAEFRAKLEQTLVDAEVDDPGAAAAAVIAVCDGVIVRFLLHGQVESPEEIAAAAARTFDLLGR